MLEPSEVIDLFFNHLPTKKIRQGEIIFQQGDTGSIMYALMSGEVELHKHGKVVETIHQHDVFGEGALVQPQRDRCTTAIAKVDHCILDCHRLTIQ